MQRSQAQGVKEIIGMMPMATLFLCLPAALVLMACGCRVAVLWPPAVWHADHPRAAGDVAGAIPREPQG
jgi:hypothetical protein